MWWRYAITAVRQQLMGHKLTWGQTVKASGVAMVGRVPLRVGWRVMGVSLVPLLGC